jgi:hypothetical protein
MSHHLEDGGKRHCSPSNTCYLGLLVACPKKACQRSGTSYIREVLAQAQFQSPMYATSCGLKVIRQRPFSLNITPVSY